MEGRLKVGDQIRKTKARFKNIEAYESFINKIDDGYDADDSIFKCSIFLMPQDGRQISSSAFHPKVLTALTKPFSPLPALRYHVCNQLVYQWWTSGRSVRDLPIFNGHNYKIDAPHFKKVNRSQYGNGCDFKHRNIEYQGNTCFIPSNSYCFVKCLNFSTGQNYKEQ